MTTPSSPSLKQPHRQSCLWCNPPVTTIKYCRDCYNLRDGCTKQDYLSRSLFECDKAGFAAGGVLPWKWGPNRDILLLMAYQTRENSNALTAYNTLGGRRDTLQEKSWETALRELNEETKEQLQGSYSCPDLVYFSGKSKYTLYSVQLSTEDLDIDLRVNNSQAENDPGLHSVDFVSLEDVLSGKIPLHSFTKSTIFAFPALIGHQLLKSLKSLSKI